MSTPSLDSVRQKFFRVKPHFEELKAELHKYFLTNPGAMVREPDSPSEDPTFSFQARKPIPARFGLITGDCLQNLRSSLDYLVWELVLAAGNAPGRRNMFPICLTPDNFEDALRGRRLKGVEPNAIAVIKGLQPYHLGGDPKENVLGALDELANINKHRRVLFTTLASALLPGALPDEAWRSGSMLGRDERPGFIAVKSSEDAKADAKLGAFMAFSEEHVKGKNIIVCLDTWAEYVGCEVIPKFERFFH